MPVLSLRYPPGDDPAARLVREGPRLPVEARVSAGVGRLLDDEGEPIPQAVQGIGLVDTGASSSMVDFGVVAALGLPPVGHITIGTASGITRSALYAVTLAICPPGERPVLVAELTSVTVGPLRHDGLIALIGRDILQHGLLVYDGVAGHVSIAF